MTQNNDQQPFLMGRMFGKKWVITSAIIIIATGIGLYFFDNTDDSTINPMDARPPAYKDTTDRGPVKLINPKDDTLQ